MPAAGDAPGCQAHLVMLHRYRIGVAQLRVRPTFGGKRAPRGPAAGRLFPTGAQTGGRFRRNAAPAHTPGTESHPGAGGRSSTLRARSPAHVEMSGGGGPAGSRGALMAEARTGTSRDPDRAERDRQESRRQPTVSTARWPGTPVTSPAPRGCLRDAVSTRWRAPPDRRDSPAGGQSGGGTLGSIRRASGLEHLR
jgi:hypothetical protein